MRGFFVQCGLGCIMRLFLLNRAKVEGGEGETDRQMFKVQRKFLAPCSCCGRVSGTLSDNERFVWFQFQVVVMVGTWKD